MIEDTLKESVTVTFQVKIRNDILESFKENNTAIIKLFSLNMTNITDFHQLYMIEDKI